MRKTFVVIGVVLLFALVASAADEPKYEAYLGYDLVGFYPNNNILPKANFNGGSGQFVYNFSDWIGVAFEGGAVNKGNIGGFSVDTTIAHYVIGPRFAWHRSHRFTPFVEALFGGASAASSTRVSLLPAGPVINPLVTVNPDLPITARLNASQSSFAILAGGGLDIKLSKHMSFRPVEFDYYLTRFTNPDLGNQTRTTGVIQAGSTFCLAPASPNLLQFSGWLVMGHPFFHSDCHVLPGRRYPGSTSRSSRSRPSPAGSSAAPAKRRTRRRRRPAERLAGRGGDRRTPRPVRQNAAGDGEFEQAGERARNRAGPAPLWLLVAISAGCPGLSHKLRSAKPTRIDSNVLGCRDHFGMLLLRRFLLCKCAGFAGREELSSIELAEDLDQFRD